MESNEQQTHKQMAIHMTKYNVLALLIGPPAFLLSVVTGSWSYFVIAVPVVIALSFLDKKQVNYSKEHE